MNRHESNQTKTSFDNLMREIDGEIEAANKSGGEAFSAGEYHRVDAVREHVQQLNEYRQRLESLRRDWPKLVGVFNNQETLTSRKESPKIEQKTVTHHPLPKKNSYLGRLDSGERTTEKEFWRPILQVLVKMGGKGKPVKVLKEVEKLMQGRLNQVDYEAVPSIPNKPRWDNTARWARNQLKEEGLLRDDSPHGTWEISAKGREYLQKNRR